MKCPTAEDRRHAFDQEPSWSVRALLPALNWHDLWADEEEEEWLLYPLVPARRLIALFSAAKTGKSLLMLEIAAALSTGRKVLGHDVGRRIRVLYVDFENDPRGDVRTRLQDMGYEPGDLDFLDYLSFPSLPYLDSEAGASALLAAVETYGPELVVIDTISRAVGGEENDNDTWLNLYKHTGLALKRAKVAMVRLDHSGKDEARGQRGGSAKAGDIDAIWKLTTVVKDERYQLLCLDARFALADKEVTLVRHEEPLHHELVDSTSLDNREARIREIIAAADRDKKPSDWGRDRIMAWARERGFKAKKDIYEEVVKRRRAGKPEVFETSQNLPPRLGAGPKIDPAPKPAPSLPPRSEGNGHNPLSDLPPTVGGRYGAGPTPEPAPTEPPPVRGGPGQGQDPAPGEEPCSVCGEPLGWSMVRRGLSIHVPGCRTIEEVRAGAVR